MHIFQEEHSIPLFIMTDDTGIIQHSVFSVPDPNSGYTTDDNSRALIAAVMLYEKFKSKKYLKLIFIYSSFLLYAQNDKGTFKNFMDYNRNFTEEEGSEDCFGRCLWALGYTFKSKGVPESIKSAVLTMIYRAIPNIPSLTYIRGKSYSLLGLNLFYKALLEKGNDTMAKEPIDRYLNGIEILKTNDVSMTTMLDLVNISKDQIINICQCLTDNFEVHASGSWQWFEDSLTYGNALLPWSLLKGGSTLSNKKYLDTALKSLNFLEKLCFSKGYFKPIGSNTWFKKGDTIPSEFDEQPIEACGTCIMYTEAYKILKDIKYLDKAHICHEWFLGKNSKSKVLVDSFTNGSYDGIMKTHVNLNQGAESILAKIITELTLDNL
ncbi:glycosyltransferase [Clostridium sp. JNZ X4-2]